MIEAATMATESKDSPCNESYIFDCESLSDPDDASHHGEIEEEEVARCGLDAGSYEEDDDSDDDRAPRSFDRLQSTWSNISSWSLQGSMDTDYFFLVPDVASPPNPSSLSRSRSSLRRPFVLPSSSVRRDGDGAFPISPPTDFHTTASTSNHITRSNGQGSTENQMLGTHETALGGANAASRRSAASSREWRSGTDFTLSPTGVAIHSLGAARESYRPSDGTSFSRHASRQHSHHGQESHCEQPPPPQLSPSKRDITRRDSLTYSVGVSTCGRSTKNEVPSDYEDEVSPFHNLYDDDQSLYLDDDCLVECAQPPHKPDQAFVTSKDADDIAITRAHEKPPLLKWWKTLVTFCHPHRIHHQTVPAKPSVSHDRHRRSKSDPERLATMLEGKHIMTKRSVEAAPFKPLDHDCDEDEDEDGDANTESKLIGPPVIIKFRTSHATSSCIQELAFQIDSRADFVLDDARSLPDEVLVPVLGDEE
mmetsp:Transcript_6563/g.14410  ORF Transcript_6563/g.14410 Transcript_6563/m.14410 type:complete len:479 (-) Transcript_6563:151-1587(-)